VFECVDVEVLESKIGAWLRKRAHRDTDGTLRLAIDGKVLRGVWSDENEQFTLFSAMIHCDPRTPTRSHRSQPSSTT
jgi:hypothetical protein